MPPNQPLSRREARLAQEAAAHTSGASSTPASAPIPDNAHPTDHTHDAAQHPVAAAGGHMSGNPPTENTPRKRRRRWPWIVVPLVLIIIALGIAGAVFASQAMSVRDDLTAAKSKLSQVVPLVEKKDTAALATTAAEITALTDSANETVSTPLWDVLGKVPFVGANVVAVQETTKATSILVTDAMPPAIDLIADIDVKNLKLDGGGFNLQPFRDAQATLPVLNAAFADAQAHVDKIDRSAIMPFVDENIGELVDIVDEAAPALALAEKYVPQAITLLGGEGPRDYAILFQNNAEIRSTGGNPGAGAILHVDNGKIEMREDGSTEAFLARGRSGAGSNVLDPSDEATLFESDTAGFVQNFTRYPDFRDTAASIQQLWSDTNGSQLAGVISIDPVMLSYMLRAAGDVKVDGEDERITADNAVKLLLSDTYERFGNNGEASDAYFAKASSAIFAKIAAGAWDPLKMFAEIQRGANEQRVYLNFPDEASQTMAVDLGVAGEITTDNATQTQTGIYLNDASHSKLEYWLSTSMAVTCNVDARTVTTAMTLTNSIPDSISSGYTLGARNARYGLPGQTMMLDVISMALPGGTLSNVDPATGDVSQWERSATYNGREAQSKTITVAQGETRTVSFTSTVPEGATAPLTVRSSPTVTQTPVTIDSSCQTMFPGTKIPDAAAQ